MNEKQLKQLADLLTSFGFEPTAIEQNVTQLNNDPRGTITVGYRTHVSYTPKLVKED